jgi:hypothetical protein
VSIDDRIRTATEATAATVREIRPLELPAELPARVRRRGDRWIRWGTPLAAAALVMGVALILVALRQMAALQPGPVTSTSAPTVPAGIPRYYVAVVNDTGAGHVAAPWTKAVVGDDQTGRTVAVLNPAAGQNFYGVAAAADDRTFVVENFANSTQLTTWYLLRLTPGAAHPAQLTKLPIRPERPSVDGVALSPDGRELAVMWLDASGQTAGPGPQPMVTSLKVYSVSSGAVLHTWTTKGILGNDRITGWVSGSALTWVDGDRRLDFQWVATTGGAGGTPQSWTDTVRTIDVTAPGGDLLAGSRVAVQVPEFVAADKTRTRYSEPCVGEVTASDGTVVCGSASLGNKSSDEVCSTVPPSFVTYSGTTGKQLKVLGQWHGQCLQARAVPVWTDPGGRHVIAFLLLSEKGSKTSPTEKVGLVADGKFTPLPNLPAVAVANLLRDRLAF